MKRIVIKVPGKLIQYKNYPVSRTPMNLDVEDKDLERTKGFLSFQGIMENDYEIQDIESAPNSKEIKRRGLRSVKIRADKIGMSLKVK